MPTLESVDKFAAVLSDPTMTIDRDLFVMAQLAVNREEWTESEINDFIRKYVAFINAEAWVDASLLLAERVAPGCTRFIMLDAMNKSEPNHPDFSRQLLIAMTKYVRHFCD
jgi:hypothetical protein